MQRQDAPPARVSIERVVEWVDTDAAGHQHNSAVVRWVEAAEAELYRTLGVADMFPCIPRVQHVLNYRRKLWFGQRVTAIVAVTELGRTSMTFGFEVHGAPHDDVEGGLAAQGTFTVVYVPPGSDRAAPWPQRILDVVRPVDAVRPAEAAKPVDAVGPVEVARSLAR